MSRWPEPAAFDRGAVRGAVEEATGIALRVDDPLPDSLIARAEELGLGPLQLTLWIHDQPKQDWSRDALARWAERNGFMHAAAAAAESGGE